WVAGYNLIITMQALKVLNRGEIDRERVPYIVADISSLHWVVASKHFSLMIHVTSHKQKKEQPDQFYSKNLYRKNGTITF
ncbi:hypothetical protein ACJX0J_020091, partial [Zea mays]